MMVDHLYYHIVAEVKLITFIVTHPKTFNEFTKMHCRFIKGLATNEAISSIEGLSVCHTGRPIESIEYAFNCANMLLFVSQIAR